MISGDHPLREAVAHLEGLVLRLQAGEPVQPLLDALLEQQERLLAFPMQEDLTEVSRVLARFRTDPSARHLDDLKAAVDRALAEEGPTRSPRANRLLGMALAALEDPQVPFAEAASAFHEDLGTMAAVAPPRLQGEVLRHSEEAQLALEGLVHGVHEGDAEAARQAGDALVQAVRALGAVQLDLEELATREGRTPCMKCGSYNPGDRSTCERCGAILPAAAVERESLLDVQDEGTRPTRMSETLARLFGACDRFYAGALDPDGFLAEVAWMEGRLQAAKRMGFPDESGLEEFESGLAVLREAGETGEVALLETGRRLVWEGSGRLQSQGG